jgi:hypothetical protein
MSYELTIAPGVYRHQKGGFYSVLFTVRDSTNTRPGNHLVIYISLTTGERHARDFGEFVEHVLWPDGVTRPRFMHVWKIEPAP